MTAEQDKGRAGQGGEVQAREMKEVRRPPPLPVVKGTIGAIESPSRRSFYNASPASSTTVRGQRSPAQSYDYTHQQNRAPAPSTPERQLPSSEQGPRPDEDGGRQAVRPVFRVDHTMTSCFDKLRLERKDEIKSLFGA